MSKDPARTGFWQSILALPRTVWLLGLVSLLNDSASELVYPLLPLYLSAVMLNSARFIGVMEGIAESLTALLKLASGVLSDRFAKRKLPMVVGYALAAASRPMYVIAGSSTAILSLRILDRVGKALRSAPRDAILAESVQANQRGLAFGFHRSMDHLGAVIGPLLAYLLIAQGVDIGKVLLFALIPGIACVLLASSVTDADPAPSKSAVRYQFDPRSLPSAYRNYLLILALFSLGNSSNMFLLLRAKEIGLSTSDSLLCWAAMALIATLLSTPLSALSDRFGRKPSLCAGWLCHVLIYFGFAMSGNGFVSLLTMFAGLGLIAAATEGCEKALVADLLDAKQKATAFGWFYLASGLPLLLASILFGELWLRVSPAAAFMTSASIAALALLLLLFWQPKLLGDSR